MIWHNIQLINPTNILEYCFIS